MKRTKIFLGLTTCVLAFAALAAKKANYVNQEPVYKLDAGSGACSLSQNALGSTRNNGNQAGFSYSSSGCVTPLFQAE